MSDSEKQCCAPKRSRAGRPPDPAKDQAIMKAARDLFLERGFSGTTIEEIAANASVSKVTVYKRFCDKETLFEKCVRKEIGRMAEAFDVGDGSSEGLEQRLNAFGLKLTKFLTRPNHVALDRVMGQEFAQVPSLGKRMFEAGPGQSRARLAAVLQEACDDGILTCDDPLRAAEDLLVLWRGFIEVELKFAVRPAIDEESVRERVEHGTRTFLRAYQR
ncbi:TetR/AcrR family transcriptional regulator [Stakelama sp. CBK3Z-3]|uniref:TetR/AcrR family transcriptional regulator n=1 Tax=Stakelama flava TaxID=2860338 RepID=A0ABS6XJB3_9SPHN|nr:TetR/AcrR family transcriptional regulator [Stakelama flava]MBW4330303.1 TetR/AcrR family transcriptional regulator [Stakelama flava]